MQGNQESENQQFQKGDYHIFGKTFTRKDIKLGNRWIHKENANLSVPQLANLVYQMK